MKPHCITRPASTSRYNDAAVSALIGVILMIFLVVILTAVFSVFLFGFIGPSQKSAYIVADAQYSTKNNYPAIILLHRGGDSIPLSVSGNGPFFTIQISSGSSSGTATPNPASLVWIPGMTLYVTRSVTGYSVTNDQAGISSSSLTFPGNEVTVSVIDMTNNMLVYSKKLSISGSSGNMTATLTQNVTPSPTATAIATATPTLTQNVTPSPTATATATPTLTQNVTPSPTATATATPIVTVTPTATATATPTATATTATRTITVIWSPTGYGYGSLSPPTPLTNSQEVRIPRGSSKTIYFVPNANRAVLTIKLDGATVYAGSSKGSTISYTVSNVVEDRTLRATFG